MSEGTASSLLLFLQEEWLGGGKEKIVSDLVIDFWLAYKFELLHKADIPLSISIQKRRVCTERFWDENHT